MSEQAKSMFSITDLDNDYIEPESPTGIDALIYNDDDNNNNHNGDHDDDDSLNNINTSSSCHSPSDTTECSIPYQPIIRDDYNPSKAQHQTTSLM